MESSLSKEKIKSILILNHIPYSNKRPGITLGKYNFNPQYITIHNTANPNSSALNERLWLTNPNNKRVASWHYVLDDKRIIEAIPPEELAWHAGDFQGNNTSISIEICESGDQEVVWNNAVIFAAYLLRKRGWGVERLKTHKDWSGKNCPRLILPFWNKFVSDVKEELSMNSYEKWKQNIEPHLKAIWDLVPQKAIKVNEPDTLSFKHYVEGVTNIVEINPLDLKLIVEPTRGIDVKLKNYVNASFVWWEDAKKTKPYPTSIIAYDGKLYRNAQPNGYPWQDPPHYDHGAPAPVIIIYKDGSVAMKDANNLLNEIEKIHLAVTVVEAYPIIRKQGFANYVPWSSIAYATNRIGIFYRKKDNKIILIHRPNTTMDRLNLTAKNLKVDFGGSLDSGGSANYIVNGKKINATNRWMAAGLTW